MQPLLAVCAMDTPLELHDLLEAGARRVQTFALSCAPGYVNAEDLRQVDGDLRSFLNINTPKEWERIGTSCPLENGLTCKDAEETPSAE